MPEIVTERGVQLVGKGPEMSVQPQPRGVVFLIRNDGVAHFGLFSPEEADALGLLFIREAERSRAMHQAAQAITPVNGKRPT